MTDEQIQTAKPQLSEDDKILSILNDLLKNEDVLACMLARRGMGAISPDPSTFKLTDVGIWTQLSQTMDEFFTIVNKFADQGLSKIYFEIGEHEVSFFIIVNDVAVITITPALANKGLLDVEIENTRRDIKKVLGLPEE